MAKSEIFSQSLKTQNVVSIVIQEITNKIISGNLKPGDKLPIESELCNTFQVGRNSIREAIKILEAYGVVYIKRGEGTFVNDKYSQKMLDPVLYGILLQQNFTKDVILLRKVLDIGILHTVMSNITPSQIATLNEELAKMQLLLDTKETDMQAIYEADVNFHMTITKLTYNEMLYSVYSYVDRITVPSRTNALKLILDTGDKTKFFALHQEIITIITEKKFTDIEATLSNHYQFWERTI